jgi:mannose-6-phosphate isomerase
VTLQLLPANQPPERFYAGGGRIAAFRGVEVRSHRVPEDWVASTTTLFGESTLGLSSLPDGVLLAHAIARDPLGWLGPEHVAAFGDGPELLVKLLDAGQRLPVHAHPDVAFAAEHLGLVHGKTEAWVMLEPATVHLGFRRDVSVDELARWTDTQDVEGMLHAMHPLPLERGDAVLVPAGLPHAIGEGAFLVELQEPTDLSILLEWTGFDIDGERDGHLGLGFGAALSAVDRRGWTAEQIEALRGARESTVGELLPDAAPFFRVERLRGDSTLDAGYGVLVVVAGSGTLGEAHELRSGQTYVVPFGAGELTLRGAGLEVLRCRPPLP